MEAKVVSRAITKGGVFFAEITALLDVGELATVVGPARRNRQEALKDCLELRKVAAKCTEDSKLLQVKKRKEELEEITWTVKDLGGRLLDGAEGPPPGFKPPSWMPSSVQGPPLGYVSPGKYREPVKPAAKEENSVYGVKTKKLVVECPDADVRELAPGGGDWESKAKVALQQAFKRFGPVLEVRLGFQSDDGQKVGCVRFASAKAVELAMGKSSRGWIAVADKHVRIRQPSADKEELRKFAAPRHEAPALEAPPSKKKLRPNERFASKQKAEAEDEPEAEPAKPAEPKPPPPTAPTPEPAPPPEPDRPTPLAADAESSAEDREVAKGEEEIAREMAGLLSKPFSQQKKALKAVRARWHPDKNPDSVEVATRVFQFIQAHDEWLQHHGLA